MIEERWGETTFQMVVGNIADQADVDAVVNAANAQLKPGGGVAGAIHRAAGPGLAEECAPLAPIGPGECVITGGHELPNRRVIHCLGPVYGSDEPSPALLASCYRRALKLADEAGMRSVAFPAISTGVFGYPIADAAKVAVRAIAEAVDGLSTVRLVRLVLFSRADLDAFREALSSTSGP